VVKPAFGLDHPGVGVAAFVPDGRRSANPGGSPIFEPRAGGVGAAPPHRGALRPRAGARTGPGWSRDGSAGGPSAEPASPQGDPDLTFDWSWPWDGSRRLSGALVGAGVVLVGVPWQVSSVGAAQRLVVGLVVRFGQVAGVVGVLVLDRRAVPDTGVRP